MTGTDCGLFTYKSAPVIFQSPCILYSLCDNISSRCLFESGFPEDGSCISVKTVNSPYNVRCLGGHSYHIVGWWSCSRSLEPSAPRTRFPSASGCIANLQTGSHHSICTAHSNNTMDSTLFNTSVIGKHRTVMATSKIHKLQNAVPQKYCRHPFTW
jgi:hypothetical protein